MNKKIIATLLTSVCLMGTASAIYETAPQTVQAAVKGKVQVKGNKKVRLYTSKEKNQNIMQLLKEHILILRKNT